MAVVNVVGKMPEFVKKFKTKEDIVRNFNKVYALSISAAFDITNIQHFEENMLKDIETFQLDVVNYDIEMSWILMQLLFMRRALTLIPDNEYAIQVLELLINTHNRYTTEEFRVKVLGVYSVYMLKNGEGGLNPRQSQMDEALPHIGALIYTAMFNKKKTIINFLNRTLTLDKIDRSNLDGYFASLSLKSKKDYIEAGFDILFNTAMSSFTNECEDIFDYEDSSDENLKDIVVQIKQNINSGLNAFVHDVSIINDCSSKLTEVIINEILRLVAYSKD